MTWIRSTAGVDWADPEPPDDGDHHGLDQHWDDRIPQAEPSHWDGSLRGEYDSDNDRIVCAFCDWYDTGGPTGCSWRYHDHLQAEHPARTNTPSVPT